MKNLSNVQISDNLSFPKLTIDGGTYLFRLSIDTAIYYYITQKKFVEG